MKSLIPILLLFMLACSRTTQQQNAQIAFSSHELDLGILEYKHPKSVSFAIDNPGQTPLLILNVKTSCGCTVPSWNKKPIKPGKSGNIEVSYDSDFPGKFRKTITVFYNGEESPDTILIKGEVKYPAELDTINSIATN